MQTTVPDGKLWAMNWIMVVSILAALSVGYFLITRKNKMAMKKGRLIVLPTKFGQPESIAIPLKFTPSRVDAKFLDTFDGEFPSCNPIDLDKVTATAVSLPGGTPAIEIVFLVHREREIFWIANA